MNNNKLNNLTSLMLAYMSLMVEINPITTDIGIQLHTQRISQVWNLC